MTKALITVTDRALERIKYLINKRSKPSLGVKILVESGGCSGLRYKIEYADTLNQFDEVIEIDDVKILIDPKAILHIIGTEMDFVQEQFKSGFVFSNPNEKGRCGCGESFHV